MEKQSTNTRFCLICNYISRYFDGAKSKGIFISALFFFMYRIIEPLTSRCSKFRFKPLSFEVLKTRLEHIINEEGVVCGENVTEQVIQASGGDLRKAITLLQSASYLKGTEGVTSQDVLDIAGVNYIKFSPFLLIYLISLCRWFPAQLWNLCLPLVTQIPMKNWKLKCVSY